MDPGYATGYETDSVPPSIGKKSGKTKLKKKKSKAAVAADAGYETDDGYVSSGTTMGKSKKSRLFRLGNRGTSPPPPLPEPPAPVFRLPIAARFATTLGDLNANATADPPGPPLPPPQPSTVALRDVSSPAPTLDSLFLRDADRDSLDAPESTAAHSVDHIPTQVFNSAARRRGHINIASSDSSDNHGSTSTGHSFFSKWTTSSASSSSPQSKHPPISYPLTRSPSPPSPTVVQKSSFSNLTSQKRAPESLTIDSSLTVPDSTSRNPSPGGWSPFVVVTPNPPGTPDRSASPVPNNVRPMFLARNLASRAHLTVDLNPSTDLVMPTPSPRARSPAFPLSPSQIIAQRDLPPPSPPPTVSLPQVPEDQGYFSQQQTSRQRRQFVLNPPVIPKRGKESPFPSRPVLTSPNATVTQPGLSARVKVKRYRELYTLPKAWDDEPVEEPPEVMRDVIARFKRTSDESSASDELHVALERNQSSEALDSRSDEISHTWSGDEEVTQVRTSIMDIEKSEVARERFVQRIEAMFDQNGRELPLERP
ncbi:hypothetical protein BDZ89DRAFT_1057322 [Hymenopellis radicata]|nr:hypothetical protein BDZ89DRAFT_1057322 [Hymenopellis radicata]